MPAAVIYTRFSPRPNAEECDSCEKQEERCRAYCEHKGYRVVGVHSDEAVTGGVFERPALAAAIDSLGACEGGPVLVVDAVDRLARDMLVNLTIRYQVEKAGGRIEYANGTPTSTTPEGKLFSHILAAFAAYERDRVRYATSRGMKRRQANGEWFGRPPVGWMRDPEDSKKLLRCEQEQKALEKIRELSRVGHPSHKIAELLTEEFGQFRGNPWSARTVRKIVARPRQEHAKEGNSRCSLQAFG